jgi:3-hydroxyanthranilate 3,4-dioxygenase
MEKFMKSLMAFNFQEWIEEHRELLKPPVCNQQVFEDNDFIVMVVGGPNSRTDYHYDPGPEFFYQLEGDMLLKTIQNGKRIETPIKEGEILLLPPTVPHSPQRYENTVGLVVERKRLDTELDGFLWFCENCDNKLYEEYLSITDIVGQLPPVFDRYYSSIENRTCKKCGEIMAAE